MSDPFLQPVDAALAGHRAVADCVTANASRLRPPTDPAEWAADSAGLRAAFLELIMRGHADDLLDQAPQVEWGETLHPAPEYTVQKLRFEGYPGIWVPALFYQPAATAAAPLPAVLHANGHYPAGMIWADKQARCITLAKLGFASLSYEFLGMGELSGLAFHHQQQLLDYLGVSGVGVFYTSMKRALDVLVGVKGVDPARLGMTGLSGGGWQTILLSALDERVGVAIPVAGHSPLWDRLGTWQSFDAEQAPPDMTSVGDYDTLSALVAPRPILFIYNAYDSCCFQAHRTRRTIFEPVHAVYEALGVEAACALYVNESAGHNYDESSRVQLYRWLGRHLGEAAAAGADADLHGHAEVLNAQSGRVGVPTPRSFIALAHDRLQSLNAGGGADGRADGGAATRAQPSRDGLRSLLHNDELELTSAAQLGDRVEPGDGGGCRVESLALEVGGRWPLSARRFSPVGRANEGPELAELLLMDAGQRAAQGTEERAVRGRRIVVAADATGLGDGRLAEHDYLLMLGTGRPALGLLVDQIMALVRWLAEQHSVPVVVRADGVAATMASLLAAALHERQLQGVELARRPLTFDYLVATSALMDPGAAVLRCFGLGAACDIDGLVQLAAPAQVTVFGTI